MLGAMQHRERFASGPGRQEEAGNREGTGHGLASLLYNH